MRIILILFLISNIAYAEIIPTILGEVDEREPVIIELLESRAILRLKDIDQSGPDAYYTKNFPTFSRYDHSLGVYALLKRVNAPLNEQIAGLLHDASHTVLSHVGDIVYLTGDERTSSYQDGIHTEFLKNMGIDSILSKYEIDVLDIYHKKEEFKALEQSYPDMNADRIEYNIHTGLVFNDISKEDANYILDHIRFSDGKWFFTNVLSAKKLAYLSSFYTKNFWGSHHNVAIYTVTSAMLKHALKIGCITEYDFKYGIDKDVINKISLSKDPLISRFIDILENIDEHYVAADNNNYDIYQPVKFRVMNPLVLQGGRLQRLTDLSLAFANEYMKTKELSDKGISIKFVTEESKSLLRYFKEANS